MICESVYVVSENYHFISMVQIIIFKSNSDGRKMLANIMRMFLAIYTSLKYLVKRNGSTTLSMFLAGGDVRTTSLAKAT